MRISDWSSDVCSSDLVRPAAAASLMMATDINAARNVAREFRWRWRSHDSKPAGGGNFAAPAPAWCYAVAPRDTSGRSLPRYNRSEEHTSELQSLMRISYAVFCLKKKKKQQPKLNTHPD